MAISFFKQNYCHACYTRFAVFFPLPSCYVSSLYCDASFAEKWPHYKNTLLEWGKKNKEITSFKNLISFSSQCIVCPPARWFLYHVTGSLAITEIITLLFTALYLRVSMERLNNSQSACKVAVTIVSIFVLPRASEWVEWKAPPGSEISP